MQTWNFPIVITKDKDWYYAECPVFDWCYTQWDSIEQVQEKIQEVIKMCIDELKIDKWREFSVSGILKNKLTFFSTIPVSYNVW